MKHELIEIRGDYNNELSEQVSLLKKHPFINIKILRQFQQHIRNENE